MMVALVVVVFVMFLVRQGTSMIFPAKISKEFESEFDWWMTQSPSPSSFVLLMLSSSLGVELLDSSHAGGLLRNSGIGGGRWRVLEWWGEDVENLLRSVSMLQHKMDRCI